MIKLGQKVRDRINGFEGIVTGAVDYFTGCRQYLVSPPVDKEGKTRDGMWIDGARLEVLPDAQIVLQNAAQYLAHPDGPDAPPPMEPSH